jgi:hypothetical protein
MLARWEFEGTYENDPNGAAGDLANGAPVGSPSLVYDLERGNVVYFDQAVDNGGGDTNDWIDCNAGWGDMNGKSFTLSVWEKQENSLDWGYMVGKGQSPYKLQYGMQFLRDEIHAATHSSGYVPSPTRVLENGTWWHVAFTWSEDEYAARVYISGKLAGETIWDDANRVTHPYLEGGRDANEPHVTMGANWSEDADPPGTVEEVFNGWLDDVRIYDRQLSEEEILYLAERTTSNYYPLIGTEAQANIHPSGIPGSEVVDFRDYSELAVDWLESDLWPPGF